MTFYFNKFEFKIVASTNMIVNNGILIQTEQQPIFSTVQPSRQQSQKYIVIGPQSSIFLVEQHHASVFPSQYNDNFQIPQYMNNNTSTYQSTTLQSTTNNNNNNNNNCIPNNNNVQLIPQQSKSMTVTSKSMIATTNCLPVESQQVHMMNQHGHKKTILGDILKNAQVNKDKNNNYYKPNNPFSHQIIDRKNMTTKRKTKQQRGDNIQSIEQFNNKPQQKNDLNCNTDINVKKEAKNAETTNKEFKCNECGKYFRRKCNLKIHLKIHTGN